MSGISRWYRSRAIGGAILMVPIMGYLFYNAYFYKNREVVEKKEVLGKVTDLKYYSEPKWFKTTLTLPDGSTTKFYISPSPKAPRLGEEIPITLRIRKSGAKDYHLNRKAWEKIKNKR